MTGVSSVLHRIRNGTLNLGGLGRTFRAQILYIDAAPLDRDYTGHQFIALLDGPVFGA
jgi:hypothetical protein